MAENEFRSTVTEQDEADEGTRFADSVDAYAVQDLHNMEKSRERSQTVSLLIRSCAIAVCIGILGYSVYMIAAKILDGRRAIAEYESVRVNDDDEVTIPHSKDLKEPNAMPTVLQMLDADGAYSAYVPSNTISVDKSEHYRKYYQNFLRVADKYDNVYAWIYMTDTKVDYPVMKGTNNDYYLRHNFKGEESESGSIFADCGLSNSYYSNYNMVLYGHNMRNGSMFHSVKTWCNSAKIKTLVQTSQIEIYTREGVYIYDILSFYTDNSNRFATLSFANGSEYLRFLEGIAKKSDIRIKREYTADSHICTLITCTNGTYSDWRYVVHGILNQFIPYT